jgi:hypothetical protein
MVCDISAGGNEHIIPNPHPIGATNHAGKKGSVANFHLRILTLEGDRAGKMRIITHD